MLVSALVTPFRKDGEGPALDRFARLVGFALDHGCDQVLVAGPMGEGDALDDGEWETLLQEAVGAARPHQILAAPGHGRLPQLVARGRLALQLGVRDLLVADAPGHGASSMALRERWHGALARALPEARLWPLAAPGLFGAELLPDDLARLHDEHANVVGVVDMSGRLARLARVRALCGADFSILCGDDAMLRDALVDPTIRADGGVVAACNLAPGAVRRLLDEARGGQPARVRELHDALAPLLGLGQLTVEEALLLRGAALAVPQRVRGSVPVKAALALLGLGSCACRPPLGPLGPNGEARVRAALMAAHRANPEILAPLAEYFELDLGRRLARAETVEHGAELAGSGR
jgi:4-hydroxy-tetrahydrodipicolinate synthase